MLITRLERQKKRRHRVSVFLDGDFAFGCSEDTAFRFGMHKGMEIDEEKRQEIEDYDNRVQAKLAAERLIGTRMRSERELRRRLKEKEFPEEIIDETVSTFTRVGLLNDREFAEAFVRDRLLLRPRASSVLRRELRGHGIDGEIVDSVLAAHFNAETENELARDMADSYIRSHSSLDTPVLKRRLAGYLQRKGFRPSLVYEILNSLEK
ncbi:RecX family transcriptional regulator [bacterium]|nr:RecX family transcriptional regulator [bacterium]